MPLKPDKIEYPYKFNVWCLNNQRWESKVLMNQSDYEEFITSRKFGQAISASNAFELGLSEYPPCSC